MTIVHIAAILGVLIIFGGPWLAFQFGRRV
jgi:hypothetical protein